jgi:predicted metal-dependent hydrolase
MSDQIITVDGIGQVLFCKKSHIRKMSIKMRPFHPIRVTFPARVSKGVAMNYLLSKQEWVIRTRIKIQHIEKKASEVRQFYFEDQKKNIEYIKGTGEKPGVSVKGEMIRISVPVGFETSHPLVAQAIKTGILEKMRRRAKMILPQRVEYLANSYGFNYNRIFIKNMRTRWGSCSYANNINLSMFLLNLPEHLVDYVILHELVHTIHKNHRPEFWEKLERVCPNSAAYAKEIRQYQFFVLN